MDFEKILDQYISEISEASREKFKECFEKLITKINIVAANYGWTMEELVKFGRLDKLFKQLAEEVEILTVFNKDAIFAGLEDAYINTYLRQTYEIMKAGVSYSFPTTYTRAFQEAVKNGVRDKLRNILLDPKANRDLITKKIYEDILLAVKNGLPVQDTTKNILEYLNRTFSDVERIVRTETHNVMIDGQLRGIEEARNEDIKVDEVWGAALQAGRTRDAHLALNGKKKDDEGYWHFKNGGKTKAPGQSGIAKQDINCRCWINTVVVDYPETAEDVENKAIAYKKWLEKYSEELSSMLSKILK